MLEGCVPWPREFQEEYRRKGYWANLTIWDMLDWTVRRNPQEEAIVYEDTRITYQELAWKVDRLAQGLLQIGFKPKDRLILQLPNMPEIIYLYFACARIGVIPVASIPAHRYKEINHVARHTNATGIAIVPQMRGFDFLNMAKEIREIVPDFKYILCVGDVSEKDESVFSLNKMLNKDNYSADHQQRDLSCYRPNPLDVFIFQLSGGTSDLPKVIPRTHVDYYYNGLEMARANGYYQGIRNLVAMPITHGAPLVRQLNGTIFVGGTLILPKDNQAETFLELIEREKVTHSAFVPTMVISMLNSSKISKTNLNSLEAIVIGASKLNSDLAPKIRNIFGCKLQHCYGMGEGLCYAPSFDDPDEVIFYSVGKPISPGDEIKIVDDNGQEVAPGDIGELLTRGPYTIRGYYKAPEENERSFTADGFYRTGDLVRLDKRGNLIIEGRNKDMINRGGEKISGEEIEKLLLKYPLVRNVAVVAMPDKHYGEKVCAFIKLEKKYNTITLEELRNFLLEQGIAKYKLPERIELIDDFPLTGVGKISKKVLREDIARKLAETEK